MEWKGKEGIGKEKDIGEVKTSLDVIIQNDLIASNQTNKDIHSQKVNAIFSHWQKVLCYPQAKLDKKRRSKIEAALKLDYSVDDLKLAIEGCARSPFNMGANDRQQKYDGIDLIFRDAEHIERL